MKARVIERQPTIALAVIYGIYAGVVAFVSMAPFRIIAGIQGKKLEAFNGLLGFSWLVFPLIVIVGIISYRLVVTARLKQHAQHLAEFASSKQLQVTKGAITDVTMFGNMSLTSLAKSGWNVLAHIETSDWRYIDWSYPNYVTTRDGNYHASDVFYSVMSVDLPRKLPNVFFDSKSGRGRQFRATFNPSQKHSLEGNFDRYFDSYFATDYTVDSLSFITPEVMEALIQACEYDIEIVDDKLYMYAPIWIDATIIDERVQKIQAIKKALLNNIISYRDERLPYDQGRSTVAPVGERLLRKKASVWITLVIILLYYAFQFIMPKLTH